MSLFATACGMRGWTLTIYFGGFPLKGSNDKKRAKLSLDHMIFWFLQQPFNSVFLFFSFLFPTGPHFILNHFFLLQKYSILVCLNHIPEYVNFAQAEIVFGT